MSKGPLPDSCDLVQSYMIQRTSSRSLSTLPQIIIAMEKLPLEDHAFLVHVTMTRRVLDSTRDGRSDVFFLLCPLPRKESKVTLNSKGEISFEVRLDDRKAPTVVQRPPPGPSIPGLKSTGGWWHHGGTRRRATKSVIMFAATDMSKLI